MKGHCEGGSDGDEVAMAIVVVMVMVMVMVMVLSQKYLHRLFFLEFGPVFYSRKFRHLFDNWFCISDELISKPDGYNIYIANNNYLHVRQTTITITITNINMIISLLCYPRKTFCSRL